MNLNSSVIFRFVAKALIISLFSCELFAAVPPMEGLFRNGRNKEITSQIIVMRMEIKEVANEGLGDKLTVQGNEERLEEMVADKKMSPKYLEFIVSLESEYRIQVIQNLYDTKGFTAQGLIKSDLFSDFVKKVMEESEPERRLFYSSIFMFLLNDSTPIASFLKTHNADFEMNKEMMNPDKLNLYKNYTKYLSVVNENAEMKDELESPMNPEDEDKRGQVNMISKSRMYKKSENVKLIRDGGKFYWQIGLERMSARFDNQRHHLKFLKLELADSELELRCSEFILFNGTHELPKFFLIKGLKGKIYRSEMISLKHYANSSKKMNKRWSVFTELMKKNQLDTPEAVEAPILF